MYEIATLVIVTGFCVLAGIATVGCVVAATAAVGGTVTALKRLRLGGLWLDKTLAPGEFRELTQEELEKLTLQT